MRGLIVTGRLAEENVRRYIPKSKLDVDAIDLPVSVVALSTPEYTT